MKLDIKLKIIIIITLGILFTFSPIFTSNLIFNARHDKTSLKCSHDFNLDNENLKLSAVSEKIHIDNNWTAAKAAGICTGSGTYSDPYIIKDLEIDGEGSNSSILIENSAVYFKIENCRVYNSNNTAFSVGIKFINVRNSQLINNNCSVNVRGIILENCINNSISGNTAVYTLGGGIILNSSNNNTLSGNTVNNNYVGGIILYGSNNNTLSGNTANNNYWEWEIIFLSGSNTNTLSGMAVDYPYEIGICLKESDDNIISGNTANYNYYGIYVKGSFNNILSGNTANSNRYGIRLYNCSDNALSGNIVTNNTYGMDLSNSNNNTHSGNHVNYNYEGGIILDENSSGNLIYLNCFNKNGYLNGKDDGLNNHWDNGIMGNYWANYKGSDGDGNGIGDKPYYIAGSAQSQDHFPLMKCPSSTSQDGGGIPIELIILISIISGGTVIGVVNLLLNRHKRKRNE